MTNTMADIPYWSMIPSFTSEAKERSLVATIARTFSGLGQGIITILTPIILPLLSTGMTTEKGLQRNRIFALGYDMRNSTYTFFRLHAYSIPKRDKTLSTTKSKNSASSRYSKPWLTTISSSYLWYSPCFQMQAGTWQAPRLFTISPMFWASLRVNRFSKQSAQSAR